LCGVSLAPGGAAAAPLRTSATAKGLFVGAAVNMQPFRNEPIYNQTLSREFNLLVAENVFKFDAIHPSQAMFNFTDPDALVAFAQANGMAIRGHTLVWHSQLPGWLTSGNFTRDQVIAIMRDHIMTVVGRYRGKILAWDVVNEAIGDNGQLRPESFWMQKIGPEYIAMAFQFARQADPDAILYYNDFEAEAGGTKSDGVFNLVSGLVNQGVPIGGVGWQMHKVNPFRISSANHTNAVRIANLGLEISITEMDIRIQLPSDANELSQQALGFGDAITFCLTEPNCAAVVTWGFTDKFSWIPGVFSGFGDGLIFDMNYQNKPAYTAMQTVLEAGQTTPSFSLSVTPASLSVSQGACGTTAVGIARTGGFAASVALAAAGMPAGVTATFNPTSTTGTSSTLTVCASATAAAGSSTLTVSGVGGGLTRTAALGVTVAGTGGGGTGGVTLTPVVAATGPWFNEEQLRIANTAGVTALSVVITVQRTGGVSFSGQYNTVGGQITQSNSSTASAITYQFTLGAGQTLGPATSRVFAAQSSGSGTVHPTSGDTFTVTYTTGGQNFVQTGHF
jgi:endo-1,4-beta-xylanase